MSHLIISEPPLQVIPSLAKKIGLNEAIILQQIHYWMLMSKHEHDGYKWIYNSYPKWQEQFPFWCQRTIWSIIKKLEKLELVISGNFNQSKMDKTKWYRINYDHDLLTTKKDINFIKTSSSKDNEKVSQTLLEEVAHPARPIPETTTENTSEIKEKLIKKKNFGKKQRLPDNFILNENMISYAKQKGFSEKEAKEKFEHFKDHHLANASSFADWEAAFRTWIRNSLSFAKSNISGFSNKNSTLPKKEAREIDPNDTFDIFSKF